VDEIKESIMEPIVYTINEMAVEDRPRERLARNGASSLSPEELLAILLRVGMEGQNAVQLAGNILRERKSLLGLYRTSYQELCLIKGIGPAKAAQLLAAMELGRRIATEDKKENYVIHGPQDIFYLLEYSMLAAEQEELWVVILNTRNVVLDYLKLYSGSVNSSQIRLGEVFRGAVRYNATSIIVAHNHPSGDPTPSAEDIALTRALIQAGRMLDIEVLDHVVIGHKKFVSLKDKGYAFST